MAKAESDTQSSTVTVHDLYRLEECQSFEELENFLTAFRSHFDRITVDFENLGNRVQNVKIVTLYTTVDGLAVCFSPSYGWCVAKQGLNAFSLSTFTERFQRGTWLSVNIFPSVTEDGYHSVVNWIICPKYNISAAPFKLFCSNREAELLIMEALAFNHVKQRIANGPTRFVLLDTPMGEVWLPGAVECTTELQTDPLVLCPELCRCGRTSYRHYEHSFKSIDVNLNQSGSAVKSNEYLEPDASYGQYEHSIQSFNHESRRLCFVSSSTISEAHRTDNFSRGSFTASTGSLSGSATQHTEGNSFVASLQTPSRSESWDDDEMSKMIKWKESLEASRESHSAFRVPEVEKSVVRSSVEKCVWEDDVNSQYDVSYGDNWDDEDNASSGNETQSLNQSENAMKSIEQCDRDDHSEHRVYYSEEEEPEDVKNGSDPPSSFSGISVAELNELEIHSENEEDITSSDDEVISVDGQQFGNEPPEVESSFIMFD